jgi:cysteinyl-tRNA synthetase
MLKIYNSLTQKKESFQPIIPHAVSLYMCGITVYDDCHIGHARTLIAFDVIVRYLKFLEFDVTFVRNITDIDDKIIRRAHENNESVSVLTDRMIRSMHDDCNRLNLLSPQFEPRATEYVKKIIQLIQKIMDQGCAYQTKQGDICFDVRRYAAYGQLVHHNLDALRAGVRIEKNTDKHDPLDFVLWKIAKPNEPKWQSPWGAGRPGWHIECSAMSTALLGQPFDIHGGGLDLKFPHHENEIAQSESAYNKRFAHYWMHVGLLQRDNQKMSKSLRNFFTIKEVLNQYAPEVIRYLMITAHYRSHLQYSDSNLDNATASLTRLYLALRPFNFDQRCDELHAVYVNRFRAAMNDDFNTPCALSVLFDLSHELNRCQNDKKALPLACTLKTLGNVLGILYAKPNDFLKGNKIDAVKVEQLIADRLKARQEKDFQRADSIRAELIDMGVVIEDHASTTTWRLK